MVNALILRLPENSTRENSTHLRLLNTPLNLIKCVEFLCRVFGVEFSVFYYVLNFFMLSFLFFSRRFSKKNADYSSDFFFFKTNELTDFIKSYK